MQTVTSKQIMEQGSQILVLKSDNLFDFILTEVKPPEQSGPSTLVFASDLKMFQIAVQNNARAFIIKENIWSDIQKQSNAQMLIWSTTNIQMAMSQILNLFDSKAAFFKPGIHPTAYVHPTAIVHPSSYIGAQCTIEAHATIGANTIVFPSVYIGAFCQIGDRCILGPLTTIGADGFSYYTDKQFKHHKIPQIGVVIIEDDCEFGAHCAVDRSALTETRVRKGCKFDNFCHVAHNVEIGENGIFTAGFMVAGSTKIGRNLTTAGAVHMTGHIEIADNVLLTGRAAVTNDIKISGAYGGFPLETHRESLKTLVSLPQIKILKKQVSRILKHLNLTSEDT